MPSFLRTLVAAFVALLVIAAPQKASAQVVTFEEVLKLTLDLGYNVKTTPGDSTRFEMRFQSSVGAVPVSVIVKGTRVTLFANLGKVDQDAATLKAILNSNRSDMVFAYLQLGADGTLQLALPIPARGFSSAVMNESLTEFIRSVEASAHAWQKVRPERP